MQRLKAFLKKYERYLSAGALLIGFLWDTITLTRIDYLFEVVVLGTHLSLVTLWIVIINLYDSNKLTFPPFPLIRRIAPILMQVSFGALLSGLTVFYIKSASFTATFLFVLLLIALLIGNEFFRTRYQKLVFQSAFLFIIATTLFTLYLPVIFHSIGSFIFLLASVLALVYVFFVLWFLNFFMKERIHARKNAIVAVLSVFFIGLHVLYFTNVIPPVPLAIKDRGIYHDVDRVGDLYRVTEEKKSLVDFITPGETIHIIPGQSIAAYTAVFAPRELQTKLSHEWQYQNDNGTWITASIISYTISGGRDKGFRGYTQKSGIFPGKWRVNVKTARGQILGRISFTIEHADTPPDLSVEFK